MIVHKRPTKTRMKRKREIRIRDVHESLIKTQLRTKTIKIQDSPSNSQLKYDGKAVNPTINRLLDKKRNKDMKIRI